MGVLFIRVPYEKGDLERDPNLENYPCGVCSGVLQDLQSPGFGCRGVCSESKAAPHWNARPWDFVQGFGFSDGLGFRVKGITAGAAKGSITVSGFRVSV